jgi:sugar O-acyltransferase (sialic acid O-acetyltransferase NeuD family)
MVIVGTGGLAGEILGMLVQYKLADEIVLYDENPSAKGLLYNRFRVIVDAGELKDYFATVSPDFTVGIGNPRIREKLVQKVRLLGGNYTSVISPQTAVFPLAEIVPGTILMPFSILSHGGEMGEGCAIHSHCSLGHGVKLGKYINIGPGVTIIGPIEIGDYSYISAKALIMPNIKIGRNVVVEANAVLNRDLKDFETFVS